MPTITTSPAVVQIASLLDTVAANPGGYAEAIVALDLARALLAYRAEAQTIKAQIMSATSPTEIRHLRDTLNRNAADLAHAVGGY